MGETPLQTSNMHFLLSQNTQEVKKIQGKEVAIKLIYGILLAAKKTKIMNQFIFSLKKNVLLFLYKFL